MAYLRFLYDNLISAHTMLTLSSQATGRISGVAKDGAGVAIQTVTGSFAGAFDLLYETKIDSISAGAENGLATFKWRTSDNAVGVWEESAVATRLTPAYALSADGLGGGLSVAWQGGLGDDFAVDDSFKWWAKATYGTERLLDKNRQTYWKATGDTSENIVIDLGAATQVTAAVIHDHNLTAGATVTLQAHTSDAWGAPSYSTAFSSITDPLYMYLDQTYRYWRILIADASNPDTYVTVGNIGLYDYTQLVQPNSVWGSAEVFGVISQENEASSGVARDYYHAQQRNYNLNMGTTLEDADIETLVTMQEALFDASDNRLWVHWFHDNDDYLRLVKWANMPEFQRTFSSYLLNSGANLSFSEVVKT